MPMLLEVPSSAIKEAKDRAALLIGAAEIEASRIRAAARSDSERALEGALKEIEESNGQLLSSIRDELDRCRERRLSECSSRTRELRERAERRTSGIISSLSSGFDDFISSVRHRVAGAIREKGT